MIPIRPQSACAWRAACLLVVATSELFQCCLAQESKAALDSRIELAGETLRAFISAPGGGVPTNVLRAASCVITFPGVEKGAFIFGADRNHGVATCRAPNGWSAPVFVEMQGGGSFGLQAVGQSADLMLITTNQRGLDGVLNDRFKLGATLEASAGPVGKDNQTSMNAGSGADVLVYSRSKGLFAGIDLNGIALSPSKDSVHTYYGAGITPAAIFRGDLPVTGHAEQFVKLVSTYFGSGRQEAYAPLGTAPAEQEPPIGLSPNRPAAKTASANYQVVRIFFATDRAVGTRSAGLQTFFRRTFSI